MATVRYVKSPSEAKATMKLDEVKTFEGEYDIIANAGNTEQTCQSLKTEKRANIEDRGKDKLDKTKLAIVLLCCVVSALVAAVVSMNVVIFSVLATDGGWTGWEDWAACSVTCGIGFTTRTRTCSNPRPSITGHYCDGTSVQVQTCSNTSCTVTDGGWTSWGDWGVCSVTCGGGLVTRSRTCSNPQPSSIGKYCDGASEQMEICNNIPCSGHSVGFSVYQPYSNTGGHPLKFGTALYNNNDVFNMTSSEFVCQQEGLYFFVNMLLRTANTTSDIACYFYKNNSKSTAYGSYASSDNSDDHPSSTSSILYHLKPGDRVYLGSCAGMNYIAGGSSFTGFLVSPEY